MAMTEREEMLLYVVMWLRNHYEVGNPKQRAHVLDRIDRVLNDYDTITDHGEVGRRFRTLYPYRTLPKVLDHVGLHTNRLRRSRKGSS